MKRSSIYSRQRGALKNLLAQARYTEIGRQYHFDKIETYAQFRNRLPLQDYTSLKSSVKRLKEGQTDILWPGRIQKFAVSAGTSGKGKHLPLSDARLASDRAFMRKVARSYLGQRPNIFKLWGSHLSMPGSLEQHGTQQLGEISGFTALHVPFWLRYFQLIDPANLTEMSFQQKFSLLLRKSLQSDLRVITAVPSWILTLFQQASAGTGKNSIAEIWPNLQLLVCGGVKLAHYKSHLTKLAGDLSLDFIETYGASEGYIGYSDNLKKDDLYMPLENGLFFEALSISSAKDATEQQAIPLWQVEIGVPYTLLLTTNAGLWRYRLNDIIKFTSVHPLRFVVKGRLHDMLDDFGEALHIYEAEQAFSVIQKKYQTEMDAFSISPIMPSAGIPYHHWFIQMEESPSQKKLEKMSARIDQQLQQINRHYAIRRETEALGCPTISIIGQADINRWKKNHGKNQAQGKMPKILPQNMTSWTD